MRASRAGSWRSARSPWPMTWPSSRVGRSTRSCCASRGGEVAGLRLDDLDWRAGEVVIRGKRSRTDRLPLPWDVGEAMADYLRQARRPGFGPTVFLRAQAPITGMSGDGVSEVVRRAAE